MLDIRPRRRWVCRLQFHTVEFAPVVEFPEHDNVIIIEGHPVLIRFQLELLFCLSEIGIALHFFYLGHCLGLFLELCL